MTKPSIEVIYNDTQSIKRAVEKIELRMEKDYVTNDKLEQLKIRLKLVEKISYGLVTVICLGVATALVRLVLVQG